MLVRLERNLFRRIWKTPKLRKSGQAVGHFNESKKENMGRNSRKRTATYSYAYHLRSTKSDSNSVAPNNERYCFTVPDTEGCNIHHASMHWKHEREYSPEKDSSSRTDRNKAEITATFLQLWKAIRH